MTTTKRPTLPITTSERRKQAQHDANTLIALCTRVENGKHLGGLNRAAQAIGMNKGRLSFISRGKWSNIALNEIDLTMLSVGVALKQHDLDLNTDARKLAEQFQAQLSDLHTTAAALLKVLRKL